MHFLYRDRILTYFLFRVNPLCKKLCFPVNYLEIVLRQPSICQVEMIAADKRNGRSAGGKWRGVIGHQNQVIALIGEVCTLGLGMGPPEHEYLG